MASENIIPIRNIYYMLCYAWNELEYIDDTICGSEKFDNIENLLARILIKEVKLLIKRGFYRSYIDVTETTGSLKGSINITESIADLTHKKGKMVCTYDEYSTNVLFNKIIKATLMSLIRMETVDIKLKSQIRLLLPAFNEVDLIELTKRDFYTLRFTRNNRNYRMIINVCKLLNIGLIANENSGNGRFGNFNKENLERLYELFILNFYKAHLDSKKYNVHAPRIYWHLDNELEDWTDAFVIENNAGDRRTDIVVENKLDRIQLIIDAKFYKSMLVSKYQDSSGLTYRQGHLNQVRGYLLDSTFNGKKIGALAYPTVNYIEDYAKGKLIPIEGTPIIIKSFDLSSQFESLKDDLLSFAYKIVK